MAVPVAAWAAWAIWAAWASKPAPKYPLKGPVDPALFFQHSAFMVKRSAKRKPSRQDQMIGYAVLGLGVLAVLGVGWLAVLRYSPQQPAVTPPAVEQAVVKEGPAPKLSEGKIEGDWQTSFLDYNCLLQLHDGTFQILAIRTVQGVARYYSRGHYTLEGAFMILTPDDSLGSPGDDDPDHQYRTLGHRAFPVELRLKDGKQMWFPGPVDANFPHRNPVHPLIQFSGADSLVWTRKE